MTLKGKGIYIWRIENCEGGDPEAIAALAQAANFSHVLIKIADGSYSMNVDRDRDLDLARLLAEALRNYDIQVWGWHYVYGDAPHSEARKGIRRVRDLDLDGYVIDAERHFKRPGKKEAARLFMRDIKAALDDIPIALTSYRIPSYHPQVPFEEFLRKCDLNMPQVYWEFSHNPETQLIRTLREYQDLSPFRPIIPIGSAYKRGKWAPTVEDMEAFMATSKALNFSAVNFWEWSRVRTEELAPIWEFIRDYRWDDRPAAKDVVERYIDALNDKGIQAVLDLYAPRAAHVTATRTRSGPQALREWYQHFLNEIFPNGKFQLTGSSGRGNSRHFSWVASSDQGEVMDGNDVFGLLKGKIVYHYSNYRLSR